MSLTPIEGELVSSQGWLAPTTDDTTVLRVSWSRSAERAEAGTVAVVARDRAALTRLFDQESCVPVTMQGRWHGRDGIVDAVASAVTPQELEALDPINKPHLPAVQQVLARGVEPTPAEQELLARIKVLGRFQWIHLWQHQGRRCVGGATNDLAAAAQHIPETLFSPAGLFESPWSTEELAAVTATLLEQEEVWRLTGIGGGISREGPARATAWTTAVSPALDGWFQSLPHPGIVQLLAGVRPVRQRSR